METPSQGLMRCTKCGAVLPPANSRKARLCKPCSRTYMKDYRDRNRDKYNAYQRQWRKPRQAALNEKWRAKRKSMIEKMSPSELAAFRKAECEAATFQNAKLKERVFEAYGGWRCACCGETEKLFLTIDHIHNDGAQHRKSLGHGSMRTYRWLRQRKFPPGFQVLCMNCNFGKRMNNGVCPHQSRRND